MIVVNGYQLTLISHAPTYHFYYVQLPQNMNEAQIHEAFLNQLINGERISHIGCFFHRNTNIGFWVDNKQSFVSKLFNKIKSY